MAVTSPNKSLNKYKTIIGIDPGSTTIGYGIISYLGRISQPSVIGYGYINLKSYKGQEERLLQLHKDLSDLFKQFKPDYLAVETVYFFKNAKTIIPVLQSKGVILLTAALHKIKVYEYTPLQIKQTITGYGKADKKFIQKLIQTSLNIKSDIKPDDASDALAIAVCHCRNLTCL